MYVLVITFLFTLFLVLLFILRKKRSPLPSHILYYVVKNATFELQLKISQTSKANFKLVKRVRGYDVDVLIVNYGNNFKCQGPRVIKIDISPALLIKLKEAISVKFSLEFHHLNKEHFASILSKIDLTKMEEVSAVENRLKETIFGNATLKFYSCQLNQQIFEHFLKTKINVLEVDNCSIKDYDICYNALTYMTELKHVEFSWQHGITSLQNLAEIKRKKKLSFCSFNQISKHICPALIITFFNNIVESDGYACFEFDVLIERSYQKEIYEKTSNNVWIQSSVN